MQCSAVQCNAAQHRRRQQSRAERSRVEQSRAECSAVQCSAVQCSAVQLSAVQLSTVEDNSAVLFSAIQFLADFLNPIILYLSGYQVFLCRLRNECCAKGLLPADTLTAIFSNIEAIHQLHRDFLLPKLEERMKQWYWTFHQFTVHCTLLTVLCCTDHRLQILQIITSNPGCINIVNIRIGLHDFLTT